MPADGQGVDPGHHPDVALTEDLQALCRLTIPAEIRGFGGERLGAMAADLGIGVDRLIERAVTDIRDERYRAAARILLVDPERRCDNMTTRSALAAEVFGLNPDGFRRKRRRRGSARDEVLGEVAHQLEAIAAVGAESSGGGSGGDESSGGEPGGDESSGGGSSGRGPAGEPGGVDEGPPGPAGAPDRAPRIVAGLRSAPRALGRMASRIGRPGLPALGLLLLVAGLVIVPVAWRLSTGGGDDRSGAQVLAPASTDVVLLAGEIDVTLHCQDNHGSAWSAHPTTGGGLEWLCRDPTGGNEIAADLDRACQEQYGPAARATNRESSPEAWRCEIALARTLMRADCAVDAGGFDSDASYDFAVFAASFRARYREGGGVEALGCPRTTVHRWGSGVLQELGDGDRATGALLAASAEDGVVLLVGSSWEAFDRIKGITGAFVGYPTAEPERSDDVWTVPLSGGGSLVAARHEGPYLWIPPVAWGLWISLGGAEGCLGLPLTDPYAAETSLRQDFENGQLVLDPAVGRLETESEAC